MTATVSTQVAAPRRTSNALPFEGQDGLFFQTWYPIYVAADLAIGEIAGTDFLDGRVIVYRTADGQAHVTSAYCPHLGADLSNGKMVGDNVQCAFHKWEYDATGRCVKTAIGDPPPPSACLFRFPTVEKFGIIWAYNGTDPLWQLPDYEKPHQHLVMRALKVPFLYHCDGWIFSCNTPDMQHIKVVHGINFRHTDPHQDVDWQKFGFDYRIEAGHQGGVSIDWQVGIRGTSFFRQQGSYDGWWLGAITGHSCPRPGNHEVFLSLAVDRGDGSPEALDVANKRLDTAQALLERTVAEDRQILDTIHYRAGTLTKGDKSLARFFDYVRSYPRAHPSAEYIR